MNREEKKKVSVIMGIYNCGKYLSESIESILNQTYENVELIMCDDGSKDNTYEIAKKYQEKYPKKIILLKNEKNEGLNFTLNRCLEKANGFYIARQDGDDISILDRIEKEVEFLEENKEYAVVSTNVIYFDENSEWGQSNLKQKPLKEDFFKESPFCHAASMVVKSVYEEVGGYTVNDKLLRVEDYHLWYKIYSKGYKGYNLQEVLYKVRDNKEAFSRRTFKSSLNYAKLRLKVFRKFKISIIKYPYIIRPIIVSLLPRKIYEMLHKLKFKN